MSGARKRRLVELAHKTTCEFSKEQAISRNYIAGARNRRLMELAYKNIGVSQEDSSSKNVEVMESSTQIHAAEIPRQDEEMQNDSCSQESDIDFSSGSDEFYAPPESENDIDISADDCVGSEVEISAQDDSVADITTQQTLSNSDRVNTAQNIPDQGQSNESVVEISTQDDSVAVNVTTQQTQLNTGSENTAQNISDQEQTKPTKRKGQVNKNEWKRLKNAKLRLKGKAYVGFEKEESGKYKQTKTKEAKCLGPRCNGHRQPTTLKGGPKQDFKCDLISDDDRNLIHSHFWSLSSWEAKKVYVTGCVLQARPKYRRKTTDVNTSKKNTKFTCYLTVKENGDIVKKRVCRKMFINTLSIGEKTLRSWILSEQPNTSQENEEHHAQTPRPRSSIVKNLEEFLNSLPKVESHYCRASSSKLYVEPLWSSLREMYRFYKDECQRENKIASSWKTFYNTLKTMNLDLYVPKKDQCNTCAQYKTGNCDEQTFQKHEQKKKSAREEKLKDKEQSMNCVHSETYTVDLQAVLLAPRLNASANYYKTKLKVHNETFLNLSTKDAVCYVWHEAVAGIESDVFASIYTDFLQKEIEKRHTEKITIWSDGCGYQNRNIKLSNALLELSIKTKVIIEQKYLEVGHTFMEVDSIHSTIEQKLRNRREVYTPADYIPIIQSARQRPGPYETIYCSSDDFYAFEPVYYKSIRPGNKVGDACVNDVVAFQYSPDGIIRYKLRFQDEWTVLPVRPKHLESLPDHPKLYTGPIPIEASKYRHLQELKELVPQDYRPFYETLLHK